MVERDFGVVLENTKVLKHAHFKTHVFLKFVKKYIIIFSYKKQNNKEVTKKSIKKKVENVDGVEPEATETDK